MNRLEKRIQRLEGGPKDERFFVWAEVPGDWPEERQRAEVTALVLERGVTAPFDITLFPQSSSECREVKLIFAGSGDDFDELLGRIAKKRQRVTDRD